MGSPKYIFTASNGHLVVKLNNTTSEFDGDQTKTYKSPTLDLFKKSIKLSDFGFFINVFTIDNIETINGVVPTDIQNAFDLLLALFPSSGGGSGGAGDASASNQVLEIAKLTSIDNKTPSLVGGKIPIDGSGVTQPISATSLPLPTGSSTSSLQTIGNTSLSNLESKIEKISNDKLVSGNLTSLGSSVIINAISTGEIGMNIQGTWTGTIKVEGTVEGTVFSALPTLLAGGGNAWTISPVSTNGNYKIIGSSGYTSIKVSFSAYTSGTANIQLDGALGNTTMGIVSLNPANVLTTSNIKDSAGNVITSTSSALDVNIKSSTNLPLPTGASTESTLSSINAKIPILVNNTQPVSLSGINFAFSTVNSSNAQLASLATFTGTIEDTRNQPSISLLMFSDQNMLLTVLQYIDLGGTKLVSSTPFTVYAGNQLARSFPINGNYVRVTAQNIGLSATTTFQLDTAYGTIDTTDSSGNISVLQATQFASGNITTQNLVPNGVATTNSAVEISLKGASTLSIQTTGTYTGALSIQVTNDNSRWETITASSIVNTITGVYSATITSAAIGIFQVEVSGFLKARITGLAAMTGTATITLRSTNSSGLVTIDNALPTGANTIGAINIAAAQTLATVTTVSTVTTLANGQTAHSSASTGSPLRIGGRVVPTTIATQDLTLVAGDASDIGVTTSQQAIVKNNATSELDYNFIFSSIVTTTSPQTVVQSSGTASVRNYIKSLRVSTDTLGLAGNVWLLDGALTVSSIAITTGLTTTSVAHDLKIGDAVVFTALASGTGVTTNTIYYVTSVGSTTTFNFSATIGGANIVPSVAYTGTTMYRILDQIRVQTTSLAPTMFLYDEPLKTNPNMAINLLIPTSLTSGNIYLTINGYRGF